jgi:hypothetical protein
MDEGDLDALREYLKRNPGHRSDLRLLPARARVGGSWKRIMEVRNLGYCLELLCQGGARLRLPKDLRLRELYAEEIEHLQSMVVEAIGPCRLTRPVPERRGSRRALPFVRWQALCRGRKRVAVMGALHRAPAHLGARLLCNLALWWDRLRGADRAILVIPDGWGDYITELIRRIRIPVTCFSYSAGGRITQIFPRERCDSSTNSPYVMFPLDSPPPEPLREFSRASPELDVMYRSGRWELALRGLPVLWYHPSGDLMFDWQRPVRFRSAGVQTWERHLEEVERLRSWPPPSSRSFYYRFGRERWLESLVIRAHRRIRADCVDVVYCQVPTFVEGDRKVLDILTATESGRLVVIELKPRREIGLLLQGLDYWDRVRRHVAGRDFEKAGYFPEIELSPDPPLLYLVSPLFEFHPVLPVLRSYLDTAVRFECVGINSDWRRGLRILRRFTL